MKRAHRLTAFIVLLSLCLLNINLCPGAEKEVFLSSSMNAVTSVTQTGDIMGTIVKGEKVDVREYFSSILDIRKFGVNPSDRKIASVTKEGIVRGRKAGTAVIRAYNSAGVEIANRKIVVEVPIMRLPFIADLTASCNAADHIFGTGVKPQFYTSSKPEVADIDFLTGDITVKKKGKTKITAYFGPDKKGPKVVSTLKVLSGSPEMLTWSVDLGNGETKKVKGYYDAAMAKKIYNLINDHRMQKGSEEDNEYVLPFKAAYDDGSPSQNALNAIAEKRALEAAVLFAHIRPSETSYYTAFNEETILNREYDLITVRKALTGRYAGEDMIGGKKYDSAFSAFSDIKSHNSNLMDSEYFDGMGVAVFVSNNKTKLTNGTKQKLKYYIVIDYIGPKKPSSNYGLNTFSLIEGE